MEKEKRTRGITDVLLILVITILAGTVLILACGASPMEAYGLFFRGIFGTPAGFAEIFVKACPLILTGLGCAVAYRTGFFNIGAEGQFYVGAMATNYHGSSELDCCSGNTKNYPFPGNRISGRWRVGADRSSVQSEIQYFRNYCHYHAELYCN